MTLKRERRIDSKRWPGQVYCVERRDDREWQSVFPEALADESELHVSAGKAWEHIKAVVRREEPDTCLAT